MFINIHHSQLIRSIGINRVLIASCLYSCLQNPLLTLNDYLCRFTVIGQRGMGWKCVSGSVQIHHHCWKNSGTLINMVQRHPSAYVEKQDKDVFLCPWSLIRTEEELKYKIECFKHCRQSNIWFFLMKHNHLESFCCKWIELVSILLFGNSFDIYILYSWKLCMLCKERLIISEVIQIVLYCLSDFVWFIQKCQISVNLTQIIEDSRTKG